MARQVAVLLAVLFAVIAVAYAAPDGTIAAVSPTGAAEAPDSAIGAIDEGEASGPAAAEAAPVGGPVPPGTFATDSPTSSPSGKSGAAALKVSAFAGVVAVVAGYFL